MAAIQYSEGGFIPPASTIAVQVHPDECILVRTPGEDGFHCCRGARHGSVTHGASAAGDAAAK